jgi:cell wall-associated NlpC family hydrolase
MTPQPGDYGLVRTKGFAAACIRLGTRSPVNHAFIYTGGNEIVEAQPDGALECQLHYKRVKWSNADLDDDQRAKVVAAARAQIGMPYSWLDILVLTLNSVGWDMGWAHRRLNKKRQRVCSWLVAQAYQAAGLDFRWDRDPSSVTPADLLLYTDGLDGWS